MDDFECSECREGPIQFELGPDGRLVIRVAIQGGVDQANEGLITFALPLVESIALVQLHQRSDEDIGPYCRKLGGQLRALCGLQMASLTITTVDLSTGIALLACLHEGLAGLTRQIKSIEQVGLLSLESDQQTKDSGTIRDLLAASRLRWP